MARNQNTLAKRIRELEKKRKAEEKRARRRDRKEQPDEPGTGEGLGDIRDEDGSVEGGLD